MKMKKFMILFIILGIGMLNSGCMITQEDYLRAAEKYMKKKYGEEFEGMYFYEDDSMYVVPKSKPNWYVSVKFDDPKLLSVKFHDNYVSFLVKEDMEERIKLVANEIFSKCEVFCDPLGFSLPDSWNRNTQFEEYREKKIFQLTIYVSGINDNQEVDLNKLKKSFYSLKVNFNGVNIVYISEEQLNDLDKKKADQIFSNSEYICRAFFIWNITEDNADDTIYWYQGK